MQKLKFSFACISPTPIHTFVCLNCVLNMHVVSVYVCVYVCGYVSMCVYIYVCEWVCVCVHKDVYSSV